MFFLLTRWWGQVVLYVFKGHQVSAETTVKEIEAEDRKPLIGRCDHRLDPKWRFTIPLQWFERMGRPREVYAMRSLSREPCLEVFGAADFDERLRPFRSRALSDARMAAFLRDLSEATELLTVDSQNRIRIPDAMLAYAGLESDIVLYGSDYHFEVWSLTKRPKLLGNDPGRIDSLAAESKELNF